MDPGRMNEPSECQQSAQDATEEGAEGSEKTPGTERSEGETSSSPCPSGDKNPTLLKNSNTSQVSSSNNMKSLPGKKKAKRPSYRENRDPLPAPYFYYIDHSQDNDYDPLVPLSPALSCPNYVIKLHAILVCEHLSEFIGWLPHGRSWKVFDPPGFEKQVLPKYFQQSTIASFYRQANGWGFRRMLKGPDKGSFYNERFLRGLPYLAKKMKRIGAKLGNDDNINHEPDLWKISVDCPLPIGTSHDTAYCYTVLSTINRCIEEGGPKAKMPVVHHAASTSHTSNGPRTSSDAAAVAESRAVSGPPAGTANVVTSHLASSEPLSSPDQLSSPGQEGLGTSLNEALMQQPANADQLRDHQRNSLLGQQLQTQQHQNQANQMLQALSEIYRGATSIAPQDQAQQQSRVSNTGIANIMESAGHFQPSAATPAAASSFLAGNFGAANAGQPAQQIRVGSFPQASVGVNINDILRLNPQSRSLSSLATVVQNFIGNQSQSGARPYLDFNNAGSLQLEQLQQLQQSQALASVEITPSPMLRTSSLTVSSSTVDVLAEARAAEARAHALYQPQRNLRQERSFQEALHQHQQQMLQVSQQHPHHTPIHQEQRIPNQMNMPPITSFLESLRTQNENFTQSQEQQLQQLRINQFRPMNAMFQQHPQTPMLITQHVPSNQAYASEAASLLENFRTQLLQLQLQQHLGQGAQEQHQEGAHQHRPEDATQRRNGASR